MRKIFFFAFILIVLLPLVKAEGNLTLNVYDEETLNLVPFITTLTNGSQSLKDGRFSTFDTETDTTGFWTAANVQQSCDYDTATTMTQTCNNGGGCASATIEITCLVAVPHYPSTSSPRSILHVRGSTTGTGDIIVQVYDESLGSYTTVIGAFSGAVSTQNVTLSNDNGRYSQDGTMKIKITTSAAYANTNVMTIYDVWTTENYGANLLPTISTTTHGFFRSALNDRDIGGLPLGSLQMQLISDQYLTVNDYPQRNMVFGMTNETNYTAKAYLLKSSSGTSSVFTVISSTFNPLNQVLVQAQRNLNGSYVDVASGYTDSSGTITFFLKTGVDYNIIATKSGYGVATRTVTPAAGLSYSIQLSQPSASNFRTAFGDIYYQFLPVGNTLNPEASAKNSINLSLIAFNNNLQAWGLNVTLVPYNGTGTVLSQFTSTTSSGGIGTTSFNVSNASSFDRLHVTGFIQRIGEDPLKFTQDYILLTVTPSTNSLYFFISGLSAQGFQQWQIILMGVFITLILGGFLGVKGFGTYGIGIVALIVFGFFAAVGLIQTTTIVFLGLLVVFLYFVVKQGGV